MSLSASRIVRRLAREDPGRPAVVTADRTWTYAEIDAVVEAHAAWLYAQRVNGADGIVALRFRTGLPLTISSLAVERSGRVCSLIDPLAPPARARFMVDDLAQGSTTPLLVTDSPGDLDEMAGVLFADLPDSAPGPPVPESAALDVDELQQVVYTSGSTGRPTGIGMSGRNREATGRWVASFGVLGEGVRFGGVSAGSLGPSAEMAHHVLGHGATLHIHDVLSAGLETVPAWLIDQRIGLTALVPTLLRFLLPLFDGQLGPDGVLPELTDVALWGEGSHWSDLAGFARHMRSDARLHNAYGTTETGGLVAAMTLSVAEVRAAGARSGPVPAGLPLPDVAVRIMLPDGSDAAAGETGEVLVRSSHLSEGYWHRPDLTASVFSPDADGVTVCRTADGGWLDDHGVLHVSGRLDDVVKISGHRVALAELEETARAQHGVSQAVALARPDEHEDLRLHLYVVPREGVNLDRRWLRSALARSLPPSALPDTVDILDRLPTLANGKVNRKDLPAPNRRRAVAAAADDEFTGRLRALFSEVLGCGPIGSDDDFFESGGDSVRAGRLVAALQLRFGHYVPTSLLLEAPTPSSLAAALASSRDALLVPVRTTGAAPPLFVVHGGAGDVMFARTLAEHLDGEQPVYALQPPALRGPTPFVPSLYEMAQHYLAQIRTVWPAGPFRLFGYSFGGVVAFEVALALQAEGMSVELLALGDAWSPNLAAELLPEFERVQRDQRAARSILSRTRDAIGHRQRQIRRVLAGEPRRTPAWQAFLAGADPHPHIREAAYLHVYGPLAERHRISGVFRGEATLVVATRSPGPVDRGWTRHIDGSLRIVDFDVDHGGLVHEPGISELARVFAAPGAYEHTVTASASR